HNFLFYFLPRGITRLEGHVHVGDPSTELIGDRHHGRFRDLLHGQAGGFQLLGAQTVASHVDDVIHPAQNAIVAVLRLHGAITGEVGPVTPVFAVLIAAIFGIVRRDKALAITPDGLETAWPGIAYTDIPGFARAGGDLIAMLIVDHRV